MHVTQLCRSLIATLVQQSIVQACNFVIGKTLVTLLQYGDIAIILSVKILTKFLLHIMQLQYGQL